MRKFVGKMLKVVAVSLVAINIIILLAVGWLAVNAHMLQKEWCNAFAVTNAQYVRDGGQIGMRFDCVLRESGHVVSFITPIIR